MKIIAALLLLLVCGCTEQKSVPRPKTMNEDLQNNDVPTDLLSIVASAKVIEDRLTLQIRLSNQNQFRLYIRSDHYLVEWYAEEQGADPPARYWGGNVISRTRPSKYGSMGEKQAGPFFHTRPLFTEVAPSDSIVINLLLHVPADLQRKGLIGDSMYISLPYWRSIKAMEDYVQVTGGRKEYTYRDSQFRVEKVGHSIQLGLVRDTVPFSIDNINKLSAGVVNRAATWIRIE